MFRESWKDAQPDRVLDLWFPDDGHWNSIETHSKFWTWRMRGGADNVICSDFPDLTEAAARGFLGHWSKTPRGRLALIIALDQFPRSLWRNTPGAYGQDIMSARLALEGISNGDFDKLPNVWEKQFFIIAISHCEGPDHLARMERLVEMSRAQAAEAPKHLQASYIRMIGQAELVRDIIAKYGRHPHRNAILGRISTLEEDQYIAIGEFPHERKIPDMTAEMQDATKAGSA